MMKATMITVSYDRVPMETLYDAELGVYLLTVEAAEKTEEKQVVSIERTKVTMESIVTDLHNLLNTYPDAKVTVIRGSRPTQYKRTKPKGVELDDNIRDIIRDDIARAYELFAPIEHTVNVKPTTPRLQGVVQ